MVVEGGSSLGQKTIVVRSDLIKSLSDKRQYRHLTLPNGLQVLLIEDEEAPRSACSCAASVGSFSDPPEAEGLAHFLEHMLFMGTETHPDENEYSAYLNAHGGMSNAFTTEENTVYYFDVQNEYLKDTLEMFSSFFVCPLFNKESAEKEIRIIDSEYSKQLQSDYWRDVAVLRRQARSDHPYSKFMTGSWQSLWEKPRKSNLDIREILLDFHKKYYRALDLKVAVYGRDTLDDMQEWVTELFSKVTPGSAVRTKIPTDPFPRENLGNIVRIKPVKDLKSLTIYFTLDDQMSKYKVKPASILCHLIGHECETSVLAVLKAKGLANALGAYCMQTYRDFSVLQVSISLTDEGLSRTDEVVSCFWAFIGILRRIGFQEWFAEEVKLLASSNFAYKSSVDPSSTTTDAAVNMHNFDVQDILCGEDIIQSIDGGAYLEVLHALTVERSIIMIKDQHFTEEACNQHEDLYDVLFGVSGFTEEQTTTWAAAMRGESQWSAELALPLANPFVPDDFTVMPIHPSRAHLKADDGFSRPVLLKRTVILPTTGAVEKEEGGTKNGGVTHAPIPESEVRKLGLDMSVWYVQDTHWRLPKTHMIVCQDFWEAYESARGACLTTLYTEVLCELLNVFSYYAECAGLYYSVTAVSRGIQIYLAGFTQKLPVLLNKVIDVMESMRTRGTTPPQLFDRIKERLTRRYENCKFVAPYARCRNEVEMCVMEPHWNHEARLGALALISHADFEGFAAHILRRANTRCIVGGNANPQMALELSDAVRSKLGSDPLPFSEVPRRRFVELTPGVQFNRRVLAICNNPKETNSACVNNYFIGARAVATSEEAATLSGCIKMDAIILQAKAMLTTQLISEPAFDMLRTQEQLGYIVQAYPSSMGHEISVTIVVQSATHSADYLDERIEAFLDSYRTTLETMDAAEFELNKSSMVETLLVKYANLNEEMQARLDEIQRGSLVFLRKKAMAKALEYITRDDILVFYDRYMLNRSPQRRKFSSQFFASGHVCPSPTGLGPGSVTAVDVIEPGLFKQSMSLRPSTDGSDIYKVELFDA